MSNPRHHIGAGVNSHLHVIDPGIRIIINPQYPITAKRHQLDRNVYGFWGYDVLLSALRGGFWGVQQCRQQKGRYRSDSERKFGREKSVADMANSTMGAGASNRRAGPKPLFFTRYFRGWPGAS